jgi:hypothetical protein
MSGLQWVRGYRTYLFLSAGVQSSAFSSSSAAMRLFKDKRVSAWELLDGGDGDMGWMR